MDLSATSQGAALIKLIEVLPLPERPGHDTGIHTSGKHAERLIILALEPIKCVISAQSCNLCGLQPTKPGGPES